MWYTDFVYRLPRPAAGRRGELTLAKKDNLILIGMPASGKSTVGVILAKVLGYDFIDSDLLIQKKEGMRLSEIISKKGIDGFIAVENEVNASIEASRSVIATGGSAIYGEEAMKHLREIGAIIYLQVDFKVIQKRLHNIRQRGVVLREGQSLQDLYEERCALYEKYADLIVREGNGEIEAVVARIVRTLRAGSMQNREIEGKGNTLTAGKQQYKHILFSLRIYCGDRSGRQSCGTLTVQTLFIRGPGRSGGKSMKIEKIKKSEQPGCVVGIGSSAGGLEALQQFLTFLPADTGMAFVVIQHLSPDHRSLLADILGKYTTMPVLEAQDGMHVRKNTVYMLPPKYNMEIEGGVLHLHEYNHQHINHPIDVFFRSLAKSYENRAVAMILSGTGSDGTNGIRSIKERNGMIIAQSPESAKFDGMPRSAIATGFVDLILNPDSIAREMAHISRSMADAGQRLQLSDGDLLSQVFSILKNVTNVNYSYYKQTTVLRRIERRIVVTHNRNLREYVNYMSNNPEEARLLAKEVLIGVTSFFRDQDYFDVLKERVVKDLLRNARPSDQIRIWVAGCSTGEEAYSIAILFVEAMEEMGIRRDIKIFATDLDADSIAVAGRGVYGDSIQEDVTITRLSRFFTKKGNRYTVNHDIRKMIVFAQHNVFQDPPFGRLDLVSCRNLLIYFQSILQRNLFAIFHMALNDGGYLFLGRSESVIDYDDVFRVLCPNEKIFIHNSSGRTPSHEHITYSLQGIESQLMPQHYKGDSFDTDSHFPAGEIDTRVLELLMPACVLVDEKNELCHSYGKCGDFITIPVGNVTLDIFSLIRADLRIAVSKALKESRETRGRVAYDKIPVQIGESPEYISLVAQPISDKIGADTGVTAIAFLRSSQEPEKPLDMEHYNIDTAAAQRIADLEKDLHVTQDNLSHTVTELESVNAELQAANEELLTANEELQSSNEELQSVNEELYTVNSEYQAKVGELASVNDDMANFLATTMVGIVMVDRKLNVRKFTEYIADEFSVAEHDVGRSLRYIAYHFATVDLIALCHQVLQTMQPVELGCASVSGKTYLVRIAPYRTHEKKPVDSTRRRRNLFRGFRSVSGTGAGQFRKRESITSGNHAPAYSRDGGRCRLGAADPSDDTTKKRRSEYVSGLVLTFIDTTQRIGDQEQIEEMAKALRAAVKSGQEKEAFLSHMSHDMRTPLTAIKGLAQLSLREKGLPDGAGTIWRKCSLQPTI